MRHSRGLSARRIIALKARSTRPEQGPARFFEEGAKDAPEFDLVFDAARDLFRSARRQHH